MTINIEVYDPFHTFLGIIPERIDPTFQEMLNDAGSGSFKVHPYAHSISANPALLNYGNIVKMRVDDYVFAWIIDKKQKVIVGEGEESVVLWEVTGSGALNLLREMILYPEYGLPTMNADVLEIAAKDKDSIRAHTAAVYGYGTRFKTKDTMTATHLAFKVIEDPESVNAPKRVQIWSGDRSKLVAQSDVISSPLMSEDGTPIPFKFGGPRVLAAATDYFACVLYVNGYRGAPMRGYLASEEYSGNIQRPDVVESYVLVGSGDNFKNSIVPIFRDGFERPAGPTVGNGWTEIGNWEITAATGADDHAAISETSVGALIREYGNWDTTSVVTRLTAPTGGSPSLVIHTTESQGLRGGFRCYIDLDVPVGSKANNVFIRKNNVEVYAAHSPLVAALDSTKDFHYRFKKTFRHYEIFVNHQSVGFYADAGADLNGKWSGVGLGAAKTTRYKAVELTCERAQQTSNPGPGSFILFGTDRYVGTTKDTRQRGGTDRFFGFMSARGVSGWYKPDMWKTPIAKAWSDTSAANGHRLPNPQAKGGYEPGPNPGIWRDRGAFWIWDSDPNKDSPTGSVLMRKEFKTTERQVVDIFATADNSYELFLDGEPILAGDNWQKVDTVQYLLEAGDHVLAARVVNAPSDLVEKNPAGFLLSMHPRQPYMPDNPDTPDKDESEGQSYSTILHTDTSWVVRNEQLKPVVGFNAGHIMTQILFEAGKRGCHQTTLFGRTWSSERDSEDKEWGPAVERKVKIGTDYYSLLEQLVETSADIRVDGRTMNLHMAVEQGIDRSLSDENLVALQVGHNVAEENYEGTGAEVRSVIVVISEKAALEVVDANQTAPKIRREMYLELGDAETIEQIAQNTDATFKVRRNPQESITLQMSPVSPYLPWRHFFVGDWILAPGADYRALTKYRVRSVTATEDSRGLLGYTLELASIAAEESARLARWLKSMVPGTGGGSVASASPVKNDGVRLIAPVRNVGETTAQPVSFKLQTMFATSDVEGFTMTLEKLPLSGSLVVTLNGVEQEIVTDYTVEDLTVTFNDPLMVEAGDRIDVRYAHA